MAIQDFLSIATSLEPQEVLSNFIEILSLDDEVVKIPSVYDSDIYGITDTFLDITAYQTEVEDNRQTVEIYGITTSVQLQFVTLSHGTQAEMIDLYLKFVIAWINTTEDDLLLEVSTDPVLLRKDNILYINMPYVWFWKAERLALLPKGYVKTDSLHTSHENVEAEDE